MDRPATSTQSRLRNEQQSEEHTRLYGRQLMFVRLVWITLALLIVMLFVVGFPATFQYLERVCVGAACNGPQLTAEQAQGFQSHGLSLPFYATYVLIFELVFATAWFFIAVLIFWRKSSERPAWLISLALLTFGAAYVDPLVILSRQASLWGLPVRVVLFVGVTLIVLCLYLFPDGRFVPGWTRLVGMLWLLWNIYWIFLTNALPPTSLLWGGSYVAVLALGIVAQIYRYLRVADPTQRQQTKWVVYGFAVAIVVFLALTVSSLVLPSSLLQSTWSPLVIQPAYYLFMLFIPLTFAIAILRYRLWDIDIIINRTLVYGGLSACVVGIYILVVGYLGVLFRTSGNMLTELLATSLVAVLFQPLRAWLQRNVNRLMYGQRDEPYAVVTRLSQRLEATLAPEAVLPTIVETVAQALKLPSVAISLRQDDDFTVAASYGKPIDDPLVLSLSYQGETVGQLLLSPRSPGEGFTATDRHLLNELARHAGLAAHAVQLTSDLQRSRERLVTAREEERRRLRRDLHDGLGSALTSVVFKMDATDELLERDPATARALLVEVRAQTRAAIDDIRRLVYNLRPPILDEWGLGSALREQVAQYAFQNVQVSLDVPESFPPLPAAVEVALYRITLEALANVIKHAQATTCTVRLAHLPDALTVEVQDDGVGRPAGGHAGVGIAAMHERAEELGGCCVVEDRVPHGTRVFARVPLRKE